MYYPRFDEGTVVLNSMYYPHTCLLSWDIYMFYVFVYLCIIYTCPTFHISGGRFQQLCLCTVGPQFVQRTNFACGSLHLIGIVNLSSNNQDFEMRRTSFLVKDLFCFRLLVSKHYFFKIAFAALFLLMVYMCRVGRSRDEKRLEPPSCCH